jgi:3-hydroxyacyl-[acyl-carrier-protein] dehydratase
MPPEAHLDLTSVDCSRIVADREAIRRTNPQRFDMEQLHAVVYVDKEQHIVVGYKDVAADEFWVPGHMPGFPLFPGVLMCEAAAQLCSWYTVEAGLMRGDFLGFGGMNEVRFRGPVRPADRLVLVAKGLQLRPRQCIYNVQGFVGTAMVFHADIIGMPITKSAMGQEGT